MRKNNCHVTVEETDDDLQNGTDVKDSSMMWCYKEVIQVEQHCSAVQCTAVQCSADIRHFNQSK